MWFWIIFLEAFQKDATIRSCVVFVVQDPRGRLTDTCQALRGVFMWWNYILKPASSVLLLFALYAPIVLGRCFLPEISQPNHQNFCKVHHSPMGCFFLRWFDLAEGGAWGTMLVPVPQPPWILNFCVIWLPKGWMRRHSWRSTSPTWRSWPTRITPHCGLSKSSRWRVTCARIRHPLAYSG